MVDFVKLGGTVGLKKLLWEDRIRDGNDRVRLLVRPQELVHEGNDLVVPVAVCQRVGHIDYDVVAFVAGLHDLVAGRDPRAGAARLSLDSLIHRVSYCSVIANRIRGLMYRSLTQA